MSSPNNGLKLKPVRLPRILLGINAIAPIGIGLSMSEIYPKNGDRLGLMSVELAKYVLAVSLVGAIFSIYKILSIIKSGQKNSFENKS